MKQGTSIGSASPDIDRMMRYKALASAFSYPEDGFFKIFPNLLSDRDELIAAYDNLFRAGEIWLYCAEYAAENEFQRSNILADVMGFYRAFSVEPSKDRPDSLTAELEFMHYLIFKRLHALKAKTKDAREKAFVCLAAEKKFFKEHLYCPAKEIADRISSRTKDGFYADAGREMSAFLKSEKKYLKEN